MKHTVITVNNEGSTDLCVLDGQRELTALLEERGIRPHRNEMVHSQCGHEDLAGNTVYIIRGTPELVQFKPYIPIKKTSEKEE
jgi:hypothetical protein